MKRLHVHVTVENLAESVRFYSTLFGASPVKLKEDYAKWLVDDPRVNFAISAKGKNAGVDHFGIQVDQESELAEVRERIDKARLETFDEGKTTCCYADADKTWMLDPSGIPWEAYQFMGDVEIFHEKDEKGTQASACCAPKENTKERKGGCCG